MDIPIRMPVLRSKPGNLMETLDPLSSGANTFLAGSLVKRDSSAKMAACVTDDTSCLGWSPGPNVLSGEKRPDVFWDALQGAGPYPFDIHDTEIILNITDGSGNVGEANGAPQLSELTVGNSYNLYRWTSGTYEGYQAVNVDGTSSTLLTYVGAAADASSTDYNGLGRFRVADAKIQV